MCTRLPLNQNGMGIIAALVVTVIVGIAMTTILAISSQKRKISHQMNASVTAHLVKQKLVGLILAPKSWQITQARNHQAFAGFNASHPPLLNLFTPDSSEPFYQTTNPAAGFDLKGNPCLSFRESGNDDCPLRYDVTLKNRTFQNSNWIDTLRFELRFAPVTSELMINTTSPELTFDLVRNLNNQNAESTCVAVSGDYQTDSNSCSVQVTKQATTCGSGQTYRGPASNASSTNCDTKTVATVSCTGSQVVKGFDSNGNPICGPPI